MFAGCVPVGGTLAIWLRVLLANVKQNHGMEQTVVVCLFPVADGWALDFQNCAALAKPSIAVKESKNSVIDRNLRFDFLFQIFLVDQFEMSDSDR